MDYQTTKTRSLNIAFVLEPDSLRQLTSVLNESGGNPDYTVKFADGTTVKYPDVEKVIQQPNSKKNSIVSLIAGTPTGDLQSAYIVLRNSPEPTVEYTINGPQQRVIYLAYKLDQWVETIRQPYSIVYQSGYPALPLVAAFAAPILLWKYLVAPFFPNLPKDVTPWIVGVWILEGFAIKLFPKATFAVGQGAKRHETAKKVRAALCYTIPSGLILSWIARWIYDGYR